MLKVNAIHCLSAALLIGFCCSAQAATSLGSLTDSAGTPLVQLSNCTTSPCLQLSGKENPHVHALPPRGYCGQFRACATFCSVHVHFVEEICNHTCWVTGLVCVLNRASLQPNRFRSCPAATSCNMCMWVCHTRLAWLVSCVFKDSLRHIAFSQVLWGLLAVATCVITTLL